MAEGVGVVREDPERRRRLAGNEETKRGIESPRNRETRKREEGGGDERTKSQRESAGFRTGWKRRKIRG